ncbi:hypothetical protein [Fodinibius salsisoli]|uniref:Uncharacterized protein n=1 Tax=Fodinibius salsisoli TaxID=2820877 RepID=A0ABT3PRI7_9BACT|nr:hypothetical protein [Fodinibius salsisoli]MCW9708464.1 hypothetical protein [Fodinibius salsisoli]
MSTTRFGAAAPNSLRGDLLHSFTSWNQKSSLAENHEPAPVSDGIILPPTPMIR